MKISSTSAPFGVLVNTQISRQVQGLPEDILYVIFAMINLNLKEIHDISLVSYGWKQITETSIFWEAVFKQAGIPIPLNPKFSLHHVFAYETGYLLENKILSCIKPNIQEITTKINFTTCEHLHFVEDTHVITYKRNEVYISSLDQKSSQSQVTFKNPIVSICNVEKMIYCSFNNGEIAAFSVDNVNDILEFVSKENQDSNFHEKPKKVLANDKWVIGLIDTGPYTCIQEWERSTHKLISHSWVFYSMIDPQIHCNKLYWHSMNVSSLSVLYCKDLDKFEGPILIKELGKEVTNLNIRGDRCFYNTVNYVTNRYFGHCAVSLDMNIDIKRYESEVTSFDNMGLNSLAISVFKDTITERSRNDDNLGMLVIYDIKNGKLLKNINIGSTNPINFRSQTKLIKIFQDSILHINSENKVIKITFPDTEVALIK